MAQEHERKFLVVGKTWQRETLIKRVEIEQGYLHKSKDMNVRIRIAGDTGYLTIKGPKVDVSCPEFEYEIPLADAQEMIAMSVTPTVRKTRHYIRDDKGQVWDLDVFKGTNRGLVMAEIEMASPKDKISLPKWVGAEVTHDRRYANTYLAEHEVPHRLP